MIEASSGSPVAKNPPSNAGDEGSIPDQGTKIPQAVGQASPWAATTDPSSSSAQVPQLEKPLSHNKYPV